MKLSHVCRCVGVTGTSNLLSGVLERYSGAHWSGVDPLCQFACWRNREYHLPRNAHSGVTAG